MIGMVVIVALALSLMWRVYRHHERSRSTPDQPSLVSLSHGGGAT